jgi:crotonobetainyl-CoA:carnitine CoA-transferase CaiB-like acyl-CoA transferase
VEQKIADTSRAPASGPLAGIRILDMTAVVLGPLATQILADYGAEVIKIEGPDGDLVRFSGVSLHPGMSSIFLALNRNKRSLAVDLKTPEGRAILQKLIPTVDVLVHNMRIRPIDRLGFGYQAVAKLNPQIVYCTAPGFGQDGPDRDKPAFDDVIQAACGLAAVASTGRDQPDYVRSLIADKTTGMALANAVLAALVHRGRTGQGQYVEVPMLETMTAFVLAEHLGGLTFNPPAGKAGYARVLDDGRKPAPTKDGYIGLLPYTTDHWLAFFKAAGKSALAERLGVADRQKRNANIAEIYRAMADITRERTTAEWMAFCVAADIPATPIAELDDLPSNPHLTAVGMFKTMHHPSEGEITYVRPSTRFAASPASVRLPAPLLGEQSAEILKELGYADGEIAALTATGIVIQAERSG